MIEEADFVIAGGGSAGCVLASRLSENGRFRVVLLEAGRSSDLFWVNMPAGIAKTFARTDLNWFYATEPDQTLNGRSVIWWAGRMLGGGSAINGMVYIRGTPYDYDAWAAAGCVGWSWKDVLPYFLRSEDFEGPPSPWHGKGGPLGVAPLRVVHPIARAFLQACRESGLRQIEDYCSGDLDGAYINFATQRDGQRCSAARGFLAPAMRRPNLNVVTEALVDRVMFEGSRVVGVRYRLDGTMREIRARGEVIVCAGAMQSPAILMRSGVGPGVQLQKFGIPVLRDAEGVGGNLHEHPSVTISRLIDIPTYNVPMNPVQLARAGAEYILLRRGLLTTCTVHAQAHGRTTPDRQYPDVRLQLMPLWHHPDVGVGSPAAGLKPDPSRPGVGVTVEIADPKSRGEIRLRSIDPAEKPVIDYRLFGDASDLARMILAVRFANRILEAPAFAKHVVANAFPENPNQSDSEWENQIRTYSRVGCHPVGSCRMGADADAVVDPQLRVRGVERLRVADASIIPVLPTANTNAPAIMIGEKAADLVKNAS